MRLREETSVRLRVWIHRHIADVVARLQREGARRHSLGCAHPPDHCAIFKCVCDKEVSILGDSQHPIAVGCFCSGGHQTKVSQMFPAHEVQRRRPCQLVGEWFRHLRVLVVKKSHGEGPSVASRSPSPGLPGGNARVFHGQRAPVHVVSW